MKTNALVVVVSFHAPPRLANVRTCAFALLILLCSHHTAFAQHGVLATNRVQPAITATAAGLRTTAIFEPKTVNVLRSSIGGSGSFTVYSIGANRRISTNVISADNPKELADSKGKTHIIPLAATATITADPTSKSKRILLPMKVGVAVDTGGPDSKTVIEFGDVFLEALESPIRWDTTAASYTTALAVGLDIPGHPEITQLPEPVSFTLIAHNATVKKNDVSVSRAGPPYQQVQLAVSNARQEASVVAHNPMITDKPLPLACAIELDKLSVEVQEPAIAAFGLGSTKVVVERLAKDQLPIADSTSLDVSLSVDGGKASLVSSTLTIPPNTSRAETELRSRGIGTNNKFLARAGGVTGVSRIVSYYFPIGLLVATLLGGPLGGFGRSFQKRKKKGTKTPTVRWVLQGTVCGTIIVAAALAGISVFSLPPSVVATELGVFLIAALAGYSGAPVLDKLMTRFAT